MYNIGKERHVYNFSLMNPIYKKMIFVITKRIL